MVEPGGATPLCVTFRVSRAEYIRAVQRYAVRLRWFQVFVVIIVVAFAAGVVFASRGSALDASICFLGGTAYVLMLFWAVTIRPGGQYRRMSDMAAGQTYCFSGDEVSMTSASGASHVKWAYFTALVETKDVFMLRTPMRSLFVLLPKRAFTTPDDAARFRELARQIQKGSRVASRT